MCGLIHALFNFICVNKSKKCETFRVMIKFTTAYLRVEYKVKHYKTIDIFVLKQERDPRDHFCSWILKMLKINENLSCIYQHSKSNFVI